MAPPAANPQLWDGLASCLIDHGPQSLSACEEAIRHLCTTIPVSWTTYGSTLQAFLNTLSEDDLDLCGRSRPELETLWTSLLDPETWSFLHQADRLPDQAVTPELYDLENDCLDRAAQADPGGVPPLCRPPGRYRVILHAYSGRRRPGDVQFYLDKLAQSMPDITLLTVSVDVVVDPTWGDIMRPSTRDFWLTNTRAGLVVGLLARPPCNTWSLARNTAIKGHKRGPRTVRTAAELWGMGSMSLRELFDVTFGNTLLIFALDILILLACNGGFGLLEHPAEPAGSDDASIWKLPIFAMLLNIPGFSKARFMQGLFGAPSAKPTELLTLNMPWVLHLLHRGRVCVEPPRRGSIGLDEAGNFKTAILKEYPPALCRCLAECFHRSLCSLEDAQPAEDPTSFLERCRAMTCTDYSHTMGKDFVGV